MLQIDGRAVVAFNAENDLEAQIELEDEIFQNDLTVLETAGVRYGMGKSKSTFVKPTRTKGKSSTIPEPMQFSKVNPRGGIVDDVLGPR